MALKTEAKEAKDKPLITRRAWSANDALRPQSLPNLSKKIGISSDCELNICLGNLTQACQNITSHPASCPICCEDLDPTDSSFQPCTCRFRLCLFCHKRILEADSRCPGCRKHYSC
uniref:RING-type domain-containing protein n=1 Tax=Kalanchoe fedtschenkoi TaxID=63787 RepID=A0A7N0U8S2_KALFE